jgi:hypothetical protein
LWHPHDRYGIRVDEGFARDGSTCDPFALPLNPAHGNEKRLMQVVKGIVVRRRPDSYQLLGCLREHAIGLGTSRSVETTALLTAVGRRFESGRAMRNGCRP